MHYATASYPTLTIRLFGTPTICHAEKCNGLNLKWRSGRGLGALPLWVWCNNLISRPSLFIYSCGDSRVPVPHTHHPFSRSIVLFAVFRTLVQHMPAVICTRPAASLPSPFHIVVFILYYTLASLLIHRHVYIYTHT